jgi:hypothetical protein
LETLMAWLAIDSGEPMPPSAATAGGRSQAAPDRGLPMVLPIKLVEKIAKR